MSDISAALHSHLSTYLGLSALVGTRVYPLQLPGTPTLPAVTYQRIDTAPIQHRSSQRANYARPRFQIDGWATTYKAAMALKEQIKDAMGIFQQDSNPRIDTALLKDDRDIIESSPARWRCSMDYQIHGEE